MATTGVVEAIDVLEDGGFCLTPRRPALPPDEFGLQGFEEGLDGRIEAPIFVKRWSAMFLGDTGG
jgi:hypothetical protein